MEDRVKVMIVEDDHVSRGILLDIMERKFPVTLYEAGDGRAAFQLFCEQLPDIVLTDVNMPEMNGVQLAEKVRQLKPETIIILITADTGKAVEDAKAGPIADYCILKPVQYKKLFHAVEQSLLRLAATR